MARHVDSLYLLYLGNRPDATSNSHNDVIMPPHPPTLARPRSFLSETLLLVSHKGASNVPVFMFSFLVFISQGWSWTNAPFLCTYDTEERLKLKCTTAAIISIYKLGSAFTTVVLLRNKHDKNTGHHTVTVVSGGGKTRDHPCFDRNRGWLC